MDELHSKDRTDIGIRASILTSSFTYQQSNSSYGRIQHTLCIFQHFLFYSRRTPHHHRPPPTRSGTAPRDIPTVDTVVLHYHYQTPRNSTHRAEICDLIMGGHRRIMCWRIVVFIALEFVFILPSNLEFNMAQCHKYITCLSGLDLQSMSAFCVPTNMGS
ncbi:hypothetical protein BD779DRAFT_324966 [Infundibulicybe gibba]|nr:hypothetical protein BD779DRAFT_324966 [Infundibulicybe gibba]